MGSLLVLGVIKMTEQDKSWLLSYLIEKKRYKELYELLLGVSEDNVPTTSIEPSLDVVKLVSSVRSHLMFLDKFGDMKNHVCVDNIHYFAYPKKYAEWVTLGAPGVSIEELLRLVNRVSSANFD